MQEENIFKTTLIISLLIHCLILISIPYFKTVPQKKELTNLEVTYRYIAQKVSKKNRHGISKEILSSEQKQLPEVKLPEEKPIIDQIKKFDFSKIFRPKETISFPKPQPNIKATKFKKIKLRNLPLESSKDPAYLSYRDIIRRKIQDKVYYFSDQYFYFDNPREGKIFVSFSVNSQGILKDLKILDEKSSHDSILRKIVTLAIQSASPFQKFPKELKYNERSFNLEISFEVE